MKRRLITFISLLFLYLWIILPVSAQQEQTGWQGKISIGENTLSINSQMNLKESGELYLHTGTLQVTGNFTGESGSKVYISSDADTHGFLSISGTATGSTEIIPDIPSSWDGSRMDFVKATLNGSEAFTFQMMNEITELKYEGQGNYLFWYIEKAKTNSCLPLIIQLANHTLLVNNNRDTNDGYEFEYYSWYKNGLLLKEGSQDNNGGSYYTGGADLDENAKYTVVATDNEGKQYLSCPYRFIRMTLPISVTVYPNPVPKNSKVNIRVETEDMSLLNYASVEIYDLLGLYIGKTNFDGQKLISMDLPPKAGIYMLKFKANDYVKNFKVIAE